MPRLPKPDLSFIRAAARRVVEILTFRTTTPGLTIGKSGRVVTIDYVPEGGGPGGDIEIPDVIGLEDALEGLETDVTDLGTALAGKAATSHSHATSDVTGLESALAGKAATSHSHATSDVTGLVSALAGKAATSHSHATSDVTGLDSALAGKAATSHSHAASEVTSGTFTPTRLPVAGESTIGGVKRNTGAAGQYIYGYDPDGEALFGTPVAGYRPNMNMIINGGFAVSQRGGFFSSAADDTYFADRWYLLRDTEPPVISIVSYDLFGAPPARADSGILTYGGFKKYGFAQIVKSDSIYQAIDGTVAVSFKAQRSAGGGATSLNLKAAVLSWTGTADTVTSDAVSSWNALGTTPTWAGSYTAEVVYDAGDIPTTWETYSFTADIDTSGVNNLILFIWADNGAGSVSTGFSLSDVQMEVGTSSTAFQRLAFSEELARCQPYYEKSYDQGTAVGTATAAGAEFATGNGNANNSLRGRTCVSFKATKRVPPSMTIYSTGTGAAGKVRENNTTERDGTIANIGDSGATVVADTLASEAYYSFHWVAEAEL